MLEKDLLKRIGKVRFLHIFAGFANTIKKRKGCIYG